MVVVTGANGFVGKAVVDALLQRGKNVRRVVRTGLENAVCVGNIGPDTDWFRALSGAKQVVHTAARVHVMHDRTADPLAAFRAVNVAGSLDLARQAARAGVQRLVFLSSVKVHGEETLSDHAFVETDPPAPADAYSISKMEAEKGLRSIAAQTGMEIVYIRPSLVYGPGVKGNFASMMHWLDKNILLPFGAIHNRRSFIALDNLVDFTMSCLYHPAAANQTFLVSDGEDLSTTELLRKTAHALGRTPRLLPVPMPILRAVFGMLGKREIGVRLCASLRVDITKSQQLLNWTPPCTVDTALAATAAWFHYTRQRRRPSCNSDVQRGSW